MIARLNSIRNCVEKGTNHTIIRTEPLFLPNFFKYQFQVDYIYKSILQKLGIGFAHPFRPFIQVPLITIVTFILLDSGELWDREDLNCMTVISLTLNGERFLRIPLNEGFSILLKTIRKKKHKKCITL